MSKIVSSFKGDKTIWAVVLLLSIISFMPVFSASTNLVHVVGTGTIVGLLVKHFFHIFIGILIVYFIHLVPFERLKFIAPLLWVLVSAMLVFTIFQGYTIGGVNASRWIRLPVGGLTFQPSSLGWISIMAYLSWFLWRFEDEDYDFKKSLLYVWLPVAAIVLPIAPANLSTAALIFTSCCMLLFVGKYPINYLLRVWAICALLGVLFFGAAKIFPEAMPSRASTWVARIERFGSDDKDVDRYQIDNAKIAIAKGEVFGVGPGKSVQKNFLPQSSSDFIYAIVVEEYGMVGGFFVMGGYLLLLFRFFRISMNASNNFGRYLVVGLGFSIVFQALINMGVAVELFPTTGQPLPLISSGGTSVWMTCLSIGIILSVSRKEQTIKERLNNNQKNQEAFRDALAEQQDDDAEDDDGDLARNTLKNL